MRLIRIDQPCRQRNVSRTKRCNSTHEATPTDSRTKARAALNRIWRNDKAGRAILLHVADASLAAIGVEPEGRDGAPMGADEAPTGEPAQDAGGSAP